MPELCALSEGLLGDGVVYASEIVPLPEEFHAPLASTEHSLLRRASFEPRSTDLGLVVQLDEESTPSSRLSSAIVCLGSSMSVAARTSNPPFYLAGLEQSPTLHRRARHN